MVGMVAAQVQILAKSHFSSDAVDFLQLIRLMVFSLISRFLLLRTFFFTEGYDHMGEKISTMESFSPYADLQLIKS